MTAAAKYAVGDIVIAKPNWPTKPAYGIWTSDEKLVTEGRPVKISGHRCNGAYSVQFDNDGDGTFNSCHWPMQANEIVGYALDPTVYPGITEAEYRAAHPAFVKAES